MSALTRDRGLHYGDGLFESLRIVAGRAPLWDWHMQRLLDGCARLRLPAPDPEKLWRRVRRAAGAQGDTAVKLLWTAGEGPRGYARPPAPRPRLLLQLGPAPVVEPRGLRLRWCATRLALQPALAGIKHLNRLEQVLARAEWCDDFDEGLMLDMHGRVVAATSANLCARIDGQWVTPPVDRCGVAGVARRWLQVRLEVQERPLSPAEVEAADALLLCNALRGPRGVRELGTRRWRTDRRVRELRAAWDAMFAASRSCA
ncbi:MAG: aminodeoxychorismate lyase [Xanthomonadales bacterium]|nr:Aminodeoxychorismate lyase [Xanthomonadales bacterium]MCC6594148.1 aminodeoxychorismate lyase [Xanthomonadales bacterium]MCE7931355.1 aminodeoxychorismate lyase [Xanthomonadales bacterium PRO6]